MPLAMPKQEIDPGRCLVCGVSLDRREGPLAEIKRLRRALQKVADLPTGCLKAEQDKIERRRRRIALAALGASDRAVERQ